MRNKFAAKLKKLSLITVHPDDDWFKVFMMLLVLLAISLCWNIYFFFTVKHDIVESVVNFSAKPAVINKSAEEDMRAVIENYDSRAASNKAIIESMPAGVADPS